MNEIEPISKQITDVKYAIMCNGSLVYDISDKNNYKLIYGDTMTMQEVQIIYEFLNKQNFTMMFELMADGVVYADKKCVEHPEKYGVEYIGDFIRATRVSVENIRNYIYERKEDIGKINIFFQDTQMRDKAFEISKSLGYELAYSEPTNMDINKPGSDKGKGLYMLMKHLNLTKNQVMTIGDNFNDLKLLQATPHAVVMKNAPNEIKKYASYITLSNDEDGVAYAIKKFCK